MDVWMQVEDETGKWKRDLQVREKRINDGCVYRRNTVLYVGLNYSPDMIRKGRRKDVERKIRIPPSPSGEIQDPSDQTYYIHTHQTNSQSIINEKREMCVFILGCMVYLCSC
jgi:hypothetical protein